MKRFVWVALGIVVAIAAGLYGLKTTVENRFLPAEQPPPVADARTERSVIEGDLIGFVADNGAFVWRGIPFAAPPVENLRWRAPQAPASWDGTRDATQPGSFCPQFESILTGGGLAPDAARVVGSEDCLYLDVYAPPDANGLPVMLWIHGGGNTVGHGASFDGSALAMAHDVVVVTINYRLGVFGWFLHPALATGNPLDNSGNYGTLDIIQALRWTGDNIASFGGNPSNVTVFGESAGARNTLSMVASPLAEGLFHRAIVQSGNFELPTVAEGRNYEDQGGNEHSGPELVKRLRVADGSSETKRDAQAWQDSADAETVRGYLYAQTPETLFASFRNSAFGMVPMPTVFADGHVLPTDDAETLFTDPSRHNAVPIILGTNRDEMALFLSQAPEYVSSTLGIFRRLKNEEQFHRTVAYQSDAWKARGVDRLATYMSAGGNPDVYAYRFDWDEESSLLGYDLSKALGAAHGLEIGFVFGDFDGGMMLRFVYPNDDAQWALARSMMSYWAEFAHSGNPRRGRDGTQPVWLPWSTEGKTSIILDSPADQGIFMWDQTVTAAGLKRQLAEDTTFATQEERCATFVHMFGFDKPWDEAGYRNLGTVGCGAYDKDQFLQF